MRYMVHYHTNADQAYYQEPGDYYIETYCVAKDDCGHTIEIIHNKTRAYKICKLMNKGKI
jgi:hypothetical protein